MEHICAEIEVIYSSQTCPEVLFVEFFVAGCCWVSACCDSVSSCCVTLLWAFGSVVIQLLGSRKAPYPASPPEETGLASLLIRMGMQRSLLINKTRDEFYWCLFSTWSNFLLYKQCLLQYTITFLVAPCSFKESDFWQFCVPLGDGGEADLIGECHVKPILMHLPTCRKKLLNCFPVRSGMRS